MFLYKWLFLLLLGSVWALGHPSLVQSLEPERKALSIERAPAHAISNVLDPRGFWECLGCSITCALILELCISPCFLLPEGGTAVLGVCAVSSRST